MICCKYGWIGYILGKTALDLATEENNTAFINLLKKYGGTTGPHAKVAGNPRDEQLLIWKIVKEKKGIDCQKCVSGDYLFNCFQTCELYGGRSRQPTKECHRCDGEVITAQDDAPADGYTVRVCKGIMKNSKEK